MPSTKRKYGQMGTYLQHKRVFRKKSSLKPRSEIKHKDYILTATAFTAGAVAPVSIIGEGTDSTDRVGRRIALKNCQVKFCIQGSSTARFRVVLFRSVGPLGTFASYLSAYNAPVNPDRAKVVMDKYVNGCPGIDAANIDMSINLHNSLVKYTADTATSDQDGQLGILLATDAVAAGQQIDGHVRTWFFDV